MAEAVRNALEFADSLQAQGILTRQRNGEVLVPPTVLTDLKSYLSVDSFRALIT